MPAPVWRGQQEIRREKADDEGIGYPTMYSASNPTDSAIRAEKPSYTPGATMNESGSSSLRRRVVAAETFAMVSRSGIRDEGYLSVDSATEQDNSSRPEGMAIKSSRAQSCILYLSSGCSERRSPPPPISGLAGLSASAGEAAPARRVRRSVSTEKTHVYRRRNPVRWTRSDISVDRLFGSICAGETVAGLAVDRPRPPTTTDSSPDGDPALLASTPGALMSLQLRSYRSCREEA